MNVLSVAPRAPGSAVTFEALFVAAPPTAATLAATHAHARLLAADLASKPAWLTSAYPGAQTQSTAVTWIRRMSPPPARCAALPHRCTRCAVLLLLLLCRAELPLPSRAHAAAGAGRRCMARICGTAACRLPACPPPRSPRPPAGLSAADHLRSDPRPPWRACRPVVDCRYLPVMTPVAGRKCDPGYTMCVPVKGWRPGYPYSGHGAQAASTQHGQRRAPAEPRYFPCPRGKAWNGRPGRAGACVNKRLLGCS